MYVYNVVPSYFRTCELPSYEGKKEMHVDNSVQIYVRKYESTFVHNNVVLYVVDVHVTFVQNEDTNELRRYKG